MEIDIHILNDLVVKAKLFNLNANLQSVPPPPHPWSIENWILKKLNFILFIKTKMNKLLVGGIFPKAKNLWQIVAEYIVQNEKKKQKK